MVKEFICTACRAVSVVHTVPPKCPECGGEAGVVHRRQGDIVHLQSPSAGAPLPLPPAG